MAYSRYTRIVSTSWACGWVRAMWLWKKRMRPRREKGICYYRMYEVVGNASVSVCTPSGPQELCSIFSSFDVMVDGAVKARTKSRRTGHLATIQCSMEDKRETTTTTTIPSKTIQSGVLVGYVRNSVVYTNGFFMDDGTRRTRRQRQFVLVATLVFFQKEMWPKWNSSKEVASIVPGAFSHLDFRWWAHSFVRCYSHEMKMFRCHQ